MGIGIVAGDMMTDPLGHQSKRTFAEDTGWLKDGTTRVGRKTLADFDNRGLPQSITDPQSGTRTFTYDTRGRKKTEASPVTGTTSYDYCGDLTDDCNDRIPTTVTDALGHSTHNVIIDGLVQSSTDADGVTAVYTYWPNRLLHTITDELGRQTIYTYDDAGRMTKIETPEHRVSETVYNLDGTVAYKKAPDLGQTSFTYDDAGRVLTTTDPTGAITRNTYHPTLGLLWKVEGPGDTPGTFQSPMEYHYNVLGEVESITDPTGVPISTDAAGTLGRTANTKDSANRVTAVDYDDNGRAKHITGPAGTDSTVSVAGWRMRPCARTSPVAAFNSCAACSAVQAMQSFLTSAAGVST